MPTITEEDIIEAGNATSGRTTEGCEPTPPRYGPDPGVRILAEIDVCGTVGKRLR
jgi:hypothetical protein